MTYLFISLGAIAGAISRYQIELWSRPLTALNFKWSTLFINVSGSFLIGIFANALPGDQNLRLMLMVGFCGSFTTFSTYSLEIVMMLQTGRAPAAIIYLVLSAVLAPLACYLGYLLTTR